MLEDFLQVFYLFSLPAGVGLVRDTNTKTEQYIAMALFTIITLLGAFTLQHQHPDLFSKVFVNYQYVITTGMVIASQFFVANIVDHYTDRLTVAMTFPNIITLVLYANLIHAVITAIGGGLLLQ